MSHLRSAFRSLIKSPLVTTIAVLSLALGIGANAAIFSIFERLVLRPLPVEAPEELVNLSAPGPKSGWMSSNNAGNSQSTFSYPMFRDLEKEQSPFTGIAAHCGFGANLAFDDRSLSGGGMYVSGHYFRVLGLKPALGRFIGPDDDVTPGAHPWVVLDHRFWRDQFGLDPNVLDKRLVVNGQTLTIIGVAPEGFSGTTLGSDPQIYVPISMRAALNAGWDHFENRRAYWVYMFARLANGNSLDAAQTSINVPFSRIIQEVDLPLQDNMSETTREQFAETRIVLEPGPRGQSSLHSEIRPPVLLLFCVTGFVLLIACANLVNLLLVRAAHRSGEIAVRMSIGARRHQIVAQLLTESFLLALVGSALGMLVARGTLHLLTGMMPQGMGPSFQFEVGASVWWFAAVLAVLTGLVGLFPALQSTRQDYAVTLKSQSGRSSSSRGAARFRNVMATAQIALSMALLIAAGLFAKSLYNVSQVDLGLQTAQVVAFGVSPERNGYTPEESRAHFERIERAVAGIPGIQSVAASEVPLISGNNWGSNVSVQGFDAGPDTDTHSNYNEIGPGYFQTLEIPLLAGREFTQLDNLETAKVAVVNRTFAEKFGLGDDAVGKFMQQGSGGENDIEIVGLVADAKYSEVKDAAPPLFFLPYRQNDRIGTINFYVRTERQPESILPEIRTVVTELDPNLPINGLTTMTVIVEGNIFVDRILSTLSAAFAVLATILAIIGLYGVIAYTVAQRKREIGLRMTLGADASKIRAWVLGKVGLMTLAGVVLGGLAALALGKLAGSLLFEMQGNDPSIFLLAAAALAAVALLSGLLPAQRAAGTDPIRALHED